MGKIPKTDRMMLALKKEITTIINSREFKPKYKQSRTFQTPIPLPNKSKSIERKIRKKIKTAEMVSMTLTTHSAS